MGRRHQLAGTGAATHLSQADGLQAACMERAVSGSLMGKGDVSNPKCDAAPEPAPREGAVLGPLEALPKSPRRGETSAGMRARTMSMRCSSTNLLQPSCQERHIAMSQPAQTAAQPPRHVLCRQRLSAALVWVPQTAGMRAARKQPAPSQLLHPWKLGRENQDLRSSHEQSQPASPRVPLVPCTPTACLSRAPQGPRPNPNTLRLTGVRKKPPAPRGKGW